MPKKMLIDATHAEETRVVVVDGNKVEEFDFETLNKRQLAGNIYLAKVTRVEPSLQAAFVDYGGNRHGFLAFAEIHPDYYQIPVADRKALLDEERALARAEEEEENGRSRRSSARGSRPAPKAETAQAGVVVTGETAEPAQGIAGMDVVDLGEDTDADGLVAVPVAPEPEHEEAEAERPYRAMDHATDLDDEIESVAEEDVAEEIQSPRKPRARRYKIQEVIKVRQIMLVQVVKEERGNKGAALTTYLSLAGRYCVLMPNTARGGGISRKITQAADRKKLKEIAGEMEVPEGAGLIIRTAGAKRTKPEIKRDYEYLMRLWEQIRELTLKSIAPAAIYEEGDLIKRSIRDLYSREIDEVLVEGEAGYRTAKDFMKMIMPSHARQVQRYDDPMPLFARHGVESYLASMFNPTVQLKSGGYIVIGVTEALVAIDVNSGRATKEGSIEETALKTNLEAADEVARQLRLRDLAGLIVIDFIDMEERRNNAAVEKRLKDKLKTDRARIQVGRISGFGLLEMSRQRLRPGMLESTTQPCPHCHGTGLIRSDDSMALTILRALEEEGTRRRSKEVLLRAPVGIVNYLFNQKREHLALIEARYGMAVRIEADPKLVSPDYSLEKFKTATRVVPETPRTVISGNASLMGEAVEEIEDDEDLPLEEADEVDADAAAVEEDRTEAGSNGDGAPGKKKRRRRRRRRGASGDKANGADGQAQDASDDEEDGDDGEEPDVTPDAAPEAMGADPAPEVPAAAEVVTEPQDIAPAKPARTRTSRSRKPKADATASTPAPAAPAPAPAPADKPKSTRSRSRKAAPAAESQVDVVAVEPPAPDMAHALLPDPGETVAEAGAPVPDPALFDAVPAPAEVDPPAAEPAPPASLLPDPGEGPANAPDLSPDPGQYEPAPTAAAEPAKPRRKGWWSLGR
ncbi:MAG: Rne/Rng family ribonuclease [Paracoccaceae bacterium]|nr:MAG: Rne/Rng family ribonuclease [Paracoccaceae bacterium]